MQGITDDQLISATRSPCRYGFHATLKPPFRLVDGQDISTLREDLEQFARSTAPVEIGELKIKAIGHFLALVPVHQSEEVGHFASLCVTQFDHFRAPMSQEKRDKRLAAGLNERQIELLDLWGYPYVLDQFKMHMTLSDSLTQSTGPSILRAAQNWFEPILDEPYTLDRICLYEEPDKDAPFKRIADFKLEGQNQMKAHNKCPN